MSDEPTYTYVKGTGWVPCFVEGLPYTDHSGTRWILLNRKPNEGERWDGTHDHRTLEGWLIRYNRSPHIYRDKVWPVCRDNNYQPYKTVITIVPA